MSMDSIIGKTPTKVEIINDRTGWDGQTLAMSFSDGTEGVWYHSQDCCEGVSIEDVNGDWSDLIGNPILVAEERTSNTNPPPSEYGYDSFTWTFYTFRGVGGSVDVRWFGESNGYYSEYVDFKLKEGAAT